jgi:zinc protease
VQLPRLYYQWHTARLYHPDDAPLELLSDILTGAKNSRLTQRMVYEMQIATSVVSYQDGKRLDGDFTVYATARPGHTLPELQAVFDEELAKLAAEGPTARELEQAQNGREAAFLEQLEQINDKADQLNSYYYFVGVPDWFARDLARYRAVTRTDIQRVAREYLMQPKVIFNVVPQGRRELAAPAAGVTP